MPRKIGASKADPCSCSSRCASSTGARDCAVEDCRQDDRDAGWAENPSLDETFSTEAFKACDDEEGEGEGGGEDEGAE
jgi:hypothetical protein